MFRDPSLRLFCLHFVSRSVLFHGAANQSQPFFLVVRRSFGFYVSYVTLTPATVSNPIQSPRDFTALALKSMVGLRQLTV